MVSVSVIVPCYNEEANIHNLLEAIYRQSYPIAEIETVIADGQSTDRTREVIADFQRAHPDMSLRVVENRKRIIPSGLNRAIEAAQGEFIVRLDAHSIPDNDYISNCIRGLKEGWGENVGGIWKIQPGAHTWIARSIAIAAAHPVAVGDAIYRIGGKAQEVDTVPFGAFHRALVERIGKFDERLLTNEDYEFNVRVRQAGGKVWLDPSIHSIYYARSTLKELSQQFWRYGYWKAQMLRRYPQTIRWRQALPPAFVAALIILGILSLIHPLALWCWGLTVLLYIFVILLIGIQVSIKKHDLSLAVGVPFAIATIHFSYGAGLLWSSLTRPAKRED